MDRQTGMTTGIKTNADMHKIWQTYPCLHIHPCLHIPLPDFLQPSATKWLNCMHFLLGNLPTMLRATSSLFKHAKKWITTCAPLARRLSNHVIRTHIHTREYMTRAHLRIRRTGQDAHFWLKVSETVVKNTVIISGSFVGYKSSSTSQCRTCFERIKRQKQPITSWCATMSIGMTLTMRIIEMI